MVKTMYHCWTLSLWENLKWKGPLPDHKGSLARIISSSAIAAQTAIPFGIFVHMTNPIIAQDVSITLAPRPSTMASQAGLLNSAYFFVCGRICETRLDHWRLISHWFQGRIQGFQRGGVQSEIYMHRYSSYTMPTDSFLEGFLNLAWPNK